MSNVDDDAACDVEIFDAGGSTEDKRAAQAFERTVNRAIRASRALDERGHLVDQRVLHHREDA